MESQSNQWPGKLKAWRGDRSQEWAARRIGVSNSAYIRWEKGTAQPRGVYLVLLENAIGSVAMTNEDNGRTEETR